MKRKHPFQQEAMPPIGQKVKELMQLRNLRMADVSRIMAKNQSAVMKHTKAKSLQASVLWELCYAFKYNFFADWAARLPDTFSTDEGLIALKIEALENEVRDLKLLNEAYVKLLKDNIVIVKEA